MDFYRTISAPGPEQLLKEKGSRFYSYTFPIEAEPDVKPIIESLKKQHFGAVHFCYAWQIGTDNISYRANDDGEPAHTAGSPIYGQIQSFGVTNILVVVVRFFGGIKLGAGGLIAAYRTSAQMALENAEIIEREIRTQFRITFGYPSLNKVMRVIREKSAGIEGQKMETDCTLTISVSRSRSDELEQALKAVHLTSIVRH